MSMEYTHQSGAHGKAMDALRMPGTFAAILDSVLSGLDHRRPGVSTEPRG